MSGDDGAFSSRIDRQWHGIEICRFLLAPHVQTARRGETAIEPFFDEVAARVAENDFVAGCDLGFAIRKSADGNRGAVFLFKRGDDFAGRGIENRDAVLNGR